tara:strand:- start:5280 stop:5624 length:345 start_codon:yes stop_codon:yes gene_type:complete
MAKVFDRVKETSETTGTGALTLAGAEVGFDAFSDRLSVGDQTFYTVSDDLGNYEVGLGTYSAANTLSRGEVYSSTNSDSFVDFGVGSKLVFITYPAKRSVTDQQAVAFAIALGG